MKYVVVVKRVLAYILFVHIFRKHPIRNQASEATIPPLLVPGPPLFFVPDLPLPVDPSYYYVSLRLIVLFDLPAVVGLVLDGEARENAAVSAGPTCAVVLQYQARMTTLYLKLSLLRMWTVLVVLVAAAAVVVE